MGGMIIDLLLEVGINKRGQLFLKPKTEVFPFIYREAMEVHWDEVNQYLYSRTPKNCTYFEWFLQIVSAAKQQDVQLQVNDTTFYRDLPLDLIQQIKSI